MDRNLLRRIEIEEENGRLKWGHVDQDPPALMIAIQEELGEVAHAINHAEGTNATKQEIAETMGLLSRLHDMINK